MTPSLALFQVEGRAAQWSAAGVPPEALPLGARLLTSQHLLLESGEDRLNEKQENGLGMQLGCCSSVGLDLVLLEEIPRGGHVGPKQGRGLLESCWPSPDGDPGPLFLSCVLSALTFVFS